MKKLLIAFALLLASAGAHATQVSSTTIVTGGKPPLYVNGGETVVYQASGTFTGRITLEQSKDGTNWAATNISTANNVTGQYRGTVANDNTPSWFRWNLSTRTAGAVSWVLQDGDDLVKAFDTHKGVPALGIYDQTTRVGGRLVLQPSVVASSVTVSSYTYLDTNVFPRSYSTVTSTGGAIVMSAAPTIATTTAQVGEIYIVQSATDTLTFQDNGTLAGSLLELGAATRVLGVGDILGLIFDGAKWQELFYANN